MLRCLSLAAILFSSLSLGIPSLTKDIPRERDPADEFVSVSALTLSHVIHHNDPFKPHTVFTATHPALTSAGFSSGKPSEASSKPSLSLRLRFKQASRLSRRGDLASEDQQPPILVPDVGDRETIYTLATMSDDAYYKTPVLFSQDVDAPPRRVGTFSVSASFPEEVMDWIDPPPNWGRNSSFGWDADGLRGYVWVSRDSQLVVIAFKGTDIFGNSSTKDRIADLLMFSCCCGHVDYSIISQVCKCASHISNGAQNHQCGATCIRETANDPNSYYSLGVTIYERVRQLYPDAQIWVTGHSLGGSMANLVSRAVTAKSTPSSLVADSSQPVFSVSFNAPAERLFASRINLPDSRVVYGGVHQWQFGTEADPIFMGRCNGLTSSCYYAGIPIETKCRGSPGASNQCLWKKRSGESFDVLAHRIGNIMDRIKQEDIPSCAAVDFECIDCDDWLFA